MRKIICELILREKKYIFLKCHISIGENLTPRHFSFAEDCGIFNKSVPRK